MANSRSARKRIRASERKHVRNRAVRSSVRTHVGKARHALLGFESGSTVDVEAQLRAAVRALDRAGEKGILHRNNVNRRKSRLTAMASRLMRAAESGAPETGELRAAAAGGAKGRGRAAAAKPARSAAKPATKATKPGAKPTTKATAKAAKPAVKAGGARGRPKP